MFLLAKRGRNYEKQLKQKPKKKCWVHSLLPIIFRNCKRLFLENWIIVSEVHSQFDEHIWPINNWIKIEAFVWKGWNCIIDCHLAYLRLRWVQRRDTTWWSLVLVQYFYAKQFALHLMAFQLHHHRSIMRLSRLLFTRSNDDGKLKKEDEFIGSFSIILQWIFSDELHAEMSITEGFSHHLLWDEYEQNLMKNFHIKWISSSL